MPERNYRKLYQPLVDRYHQIEKQIHQIETKSAAILVASSFLLTLLTTANPKPLQFPKFDIVVILVFLLLACLITLYNLFPAKLSLYDVNKVKQFSHKPQEYYEQAVEHLEKTKNHLDEFLTHKTHLFAISMIFLFLAFFYASLAFFTHYFYSKAGRTLSWLLGFCVLLIFSRKYYKTFKSNE